MGRPREFDRANAIERATRLFWAKGYSNASVRDLMKVMRIGEGSFYNDLVSKKSLYLECLRHYNDTVTRRRWEALIAEASIKRGVRKFFEAVLDDLDDPKTPNVCLMAGSLSAEVLSARDLARYVTTEMQTLEAALVERLDAARESGELAPELDSEVAAQVIVTFLQGLFRVVRVLRSRAEMERQIEALLAGLGL
ncbi:MAG TPA: TetR/AcrR family transcriptional regulator [Myxococcota bacterium]|nr:TetR/AcrR family transcriptional regulator [Myxococcota bacterium]